MSDLRDLLNRASANATEGTVVVYATAIADSENGEVLVRFDDDLVPNTFLEEDGIEVDFEEDEGSLDEIDEDANAEVLGEDDLETDISDDDVLEENE